MENRNESTVPKPSPEADSEIPKLDLNALLNSSREAIAKAAAEILEEKEAERMMATRHHNHSSHKSSSSW